MTNNHDDVMRKVEALLRLSLKAGTPEEAATAAAKASELALKYGIDLNKVNTSGKAKIEKEFAKATAADYHQWLASAVARLNACVPLMSGNTFIFNGRHANAITARLQFEYLVEAMGRLNREAVKAQSFGYNTRARKEFRDSFKFGCSQALCYILRKRYDELRSQGMSDRQENALVVANYFDQEDHAIRDALNLGNPRQARERKTELRINPAAYMQGAAAATSINLGAQVATTERKQLT